MQFETPEVAGMFATFASSLDPTDRAAIAKSMRKMADVVISIADCMDSDPKAIPAVVNTSSDHEAETWFALKACKEYTGEVTVRKAFAGDVLLKENPDRWLMEPQWTDMWKLYKQEFSQFWTAEEVDLVADVSDYNSLGPDEQHFLDVCLSFLAGFDGLVNENIFMNFILDMQMPECRAHYGFQTMIENVHAEVYMLFITTLIKDRNKQKELFNGIKSFPVMRRMAEFCMRYMDRDVATVGERVFAFALVEGVWFMAPFCAIFWLKKRGKMDGLAFANALIRKDEVLHRDAAALIFRNLAPENQITYDQAKRMTEEVMNMCDELIRLALPVRLIGMNADQMVQYVQTTADALMQVCGFEKMYNAVNPYDWLNTMDIDGKSNFFEKRVSEYTKAKVNTEGTAHEEHATLHAFTLDAEF